ncbi:MAG: iron-containing alcohol dehydrogenase [Planctomycetota bacterium]|jgi:alcohol dehydrogenase YqhD (iron-dependent ADH family)|nr:iron-containing alcohol dehydrogenase [Planctomycetota bacterium]
MINFVFYAPTKVIFGKDTESQAGAEIKALGYKKALIHYGGASAMKSGLIDRVVASLDAAGIAHVGLGGVKPNPRLALVREGIALAKREKVDFLLAVGGGSVIDSAKAIAYGITNDGDVWDLYLAKKKAVACAPVGCVLTIAAAGSETSNSSVITNDDGGHKRSYNDDIARPKFAIMNPELTFTLPEYQTMSGAVDILMHTLERYFTNDKQVELIDRMSESLMLTVIENAPKLLKNPRDYDARAEIMWAGSLSHNGLTGTGRTGDFASHQLEHELSGMFDVAHGAGLSAVWGSWARYVYKHDIARFAQFAVRVMGVEMNYFNPEETALRGIEKIENFFRSIKMPVSISELGVKDLTEKQLDEMVEKCSWNGARQIGQFVKLDRTDMRKIYQMAK